MLFSSIVPSYFLGEFNRSIFPPHIVLNCIPEGCPEIVMPNFEEVDLNRLKGMAKTCNEKGIIDANELEQWYEFLDNETEKEQDLEGAVQIIYSPENGTFI